MLKLQPLALWPLAAAVKGSVYREELGKSTYDARTTFLVDNVVFFF
jgi:hypothetical protein